MNPIIACLSVLRLSGNEEVSEVHEDVGSCIDCGTLMECIRVAVGGPPHLRISLHVNCTSIRCEYNPESHAVFILGAGWRINISFGATPVLPRKRIYRPARSPRARLTSRRRPHQAGAAEPLFCARSPPEKGPSARCSPTQVRASMVQLLMSWLRAGYEKAVTQVLLYFI